MDWLKITGFIFILFGFFIFVYQVFLKNRYRKYIGIKEYKTIRDKFVDKEANVEPEVESETEESILTVSTIIGFITSIVMLFLILGIALFVVSQVQDTFHHL